MRCFVSQSQTFFKMFSSSLDYKILVVNPKSQQDFSKRPHSNRSTSLPGPPLLTPDPTRRVGLPQGGSGGKEASGGPDHSLNPSMNLNLNSVQVTRTALSRKGKPFRGKARMGFRNNVKVNLVQIYSTNSLFHKNHKDLTKFIPNTLQTKDSDLRRFRFTLKRVNYLGIVSIPINTHYNKQFLKLISLPNSRIHFNILPNTCCKINLYTNYKMIRPLLNSSRSEITLICTQTRIPVYPDKSNKTIQYSRNRLRKQIFPSIKLFFNPKVEDALSNFADLASKEQYLLDLKLNSLKAIQNPDPPLRGGLP